MMKNRIIYQWISLLLCILIGCLNGTLVPLKPSENYTHVVEADQLNPNQYKLFWKPIGNDEIQFEVHCKSTGWVGVGISPNGGMRGSDIAIGWVANNKAYLKDCYASDINTPLVDKSQDFVLLEGTERDGYTIIKYKRKLVTCDKEFDTPIKEGLQFVIFAWNDADPVTGNNDWQYHFNNRFVRALQFLNFRSESIEEQNRLPADTFTITYRMQNITVPKKKTYYYCDVLEFPQFDSKAHLIQYEMLINPKYIKNVHHLLVYECYPGFNKTDDLPRECGEVPLPPYVGGYCSGKLIIGGDFNYSFTKEAGLPFYPDTSKRYFLFEMHYDNPQLMSDIVDDSGVKLYFTQKELRPNDLGLVKLTDDLPIGIQVPPKANNFDYTTICYPECTNKYFPEDGIYAVSGLLHTHLAGRAVRTSLIRNGTLIEHLFDNQQYDSNYQYPQDIKPKKLYRGDVLVTTCKYNTMDRSEMTFFGFGSYQEMCFDFLYYYPNIYEFEKCGSSTPDNVLYDFYRSLQRENLLPPRVLNASRTIFYENTEVNSLKSYLDEGTFGPTFAKRFTDFFSSEYDKIYMCGANYALNTSYVKHYKPLKVDLKVEELDCGSGSGTMFYTNYIILLISVCINWIFLF